MEFKNTSNICSLQFVVNQLLQEAHSHVKSSTCPPPLSAEWMRLDERRSKQRDVESRLDTLNTNKCGLLLVN